MFLSEIATKDRNLCKSLTLIELLVVMGIIALLLSVILVYLSQAKQKARDIKTIAHLAQICKALEIYYLDHDGYPWVGCSSTGESSADHYGRYRDDPHNDPYGNKIFDVLQPFLASDIVSMVPNDPVADYPKNDWSYFYDNYYDAVEPGNTPETSECNDQAFQLLGYIEVSNAPFEWEAPWGTWQGKGWYRACKNFSE